MDYFWNYMAANTIANPTEARILVAELGGQHINAAVFINGELSRHTTYEPSPGEQRVPDRFISLATWILKGEQPDAIGISHFGARQPGRVQTTAEGLARAGGRNRKTFGSKLQQAFWLPSPNQLVVLPSLLANAYVEREVNPDHQAGAYVLADDQGGDIAFYASKGGGRIAIGDPHPFSGTDDEILHRTYRGIATNLSSCSEQGIRPTSIAVAGSLGQRPLSLDTLQRGLNERFGQGAPRVQPAAFPDTSSLYGVGFAAKALLQGSQ